MKVLKILVIVVRIGLGGLFLYGGVQKFIPKEHPAKAKQEEVTTGQENKPKEVTEQQPKNTSQSRIGPFIHGLKQTGYFWPFLGIVEILCGLLLLSQLGALLGAVMLVPVTLNIFLFHLFLTPNDKVEIGMCALYLVANIFLIAYEYPRLKPAFNSLIKSKTNTI